MDLGGFDDRLVLKGTTSRKEWQSTDTMNETHEKCILRGDSK